MSQNALITFWHYLRSTPELQSDLRELRHLARRGFGLLLLSEVLIVVQLYPGKFFFDGIQKQAPSSTLITIAIIAWIAYMTGTRAHSAMASARNDFHFRLSALLWDHGHRKELALDTAWHIAHSTGEKESRIAKNLLKVENLVDSFLFHALPIVLRILITSIGVSFIGWRIGLLALGTFIVYNIVLFFSEHGIAPLRVGFRKESRAIEVHGTEITQNWRTIKQYGIEREKSDEHLKLLTHHSTQEYWRNRLYMSYIRRQDYTVDTSRLCLYLILACFFRTQYSFGSLMLVAAWMERIYSNYYRISDFQHRLNEGSEALKELLEIFLMTPTIRQPEEPQWPAEVQGKVEFKDVSFSYVNGKQHALHNIDLTVHPYQTVALVGYSGSGKSTLASLLLHEYRPTHGSLLIDGIDMHNIDYDRYRREVISVVSQNIQLFDATVRDNIRTVRPQGPRGYEEIAAQQAYADEFIRQLPQGYDTMIGEDGVRLSGGQRQRLAIARALYRQPRILVLDEATSSLDAASQKEIQDTIDQLIKSHQCTLFIIAHRFSTIMAADTVVVLDDGKIVEIGTHEELTRYNGIYNRLKNLEMQGILND